MFEPETYKPYDFANRRHIGPSPEEIAEMLKVVGFDSLDALIDATVPGGIRQKEPLVLDRPVTELGSLDRMRDVARKNEVLPWRNLVFRFDGGAGAGKHRCKQD